MNFKGMKILLVDDNPVNLRVLEETLEPLGAEVITANSGDEALVLLGEIEPSIIILDIMMPVMDGYELCSRIKKIDTLTGIPVIFITALNDTESEIEGLELGAVDFITKPINPTLVKSRIRNILELKFYQDSLQTRVESSEEQFFSLFDTSVDAQLIINYPELKITMANKAAETLFKYSKEELCNMSPIDLTPEFQPNGFKSYDYGIEMYNRTLSGDISYFEWEHKDSEERTFPCEIRLTKFPGLKEVFRVSIFDISARKEKEAEVLRANEYIESIMNSMPLSLIGVDNNLIITHWNNFVTDETGIPQENALGSTLRGILPYLKLEEELIRESINKEVVKKRHKRPRVTKKGTIYENFTVFPLNNSREKGAVILIDNITKEVQLQDRVVQSERMYSLGELAAGVVHEITNPLAGIIQNSQSLENRLTGDLERNRITAEELGLDLPTLEKYLNKRKIPNMINSIRESGMKASHIIKNLNSFTRKDKGVLSYTPVKGLITQALELAENDFNLNTKMDFKTINTTVKFEENLPPIRCESSKIIQVLINILRFATRNISFKSDQQGEISIKTYVRDSFVIIELRDNGLEIPDEDLQNIFKPYFESSFSREDWYYIALSDFIIKEIHGGEFSLSSYMGNLYKIKLPSTDVIG